MLLYVYRLSPASTSVQISCSVSRSDIIVKSWEFRRNHKPPCSVYIRCRGVNGYVQKTKPLKKIAQTDAIFENVRQENQVADDSPEVVRISMDAKAKVDVGDFSRDGESRAAEAPRALDHDTQAKTKL